MKGDIKSCGFTFIHCFLFSLSFCLFVVVVFLICYVLVALRGKKAFEWVEWVVPLIQSAIQLSVGNVTVG